MKIFFGLLILVGVAQAAPCTYNTWDWDKIHKKAINHQRVVKETSALSLEERGSAEGCSVCEQDQTTLTVAGVSFTMCKKYAEKVERAIQQAQAQGFPVKSVIGYRVGKSKGPLDASGRRTQFSNHSFGVAIDFNAEINGLYDQCPKFGPGCKLIRGGKYQTGVPGTISQDSPIYMAMIAEGFKWGGELSGKQKDFMHFSLGGD